MVYLVHAISQAVPRLKEPITIIKWDVKHAQTNQRDRRKSYHRKFTTLFPNDIDRLVFHGRATPSVRLSEDGSRQGISEGNSPINSSVRHTSSITTNSKGRGPVSFPPLRVRDRAARRDDSPSVNTHQSRR